MLMKTKMRAALALTASLLGSALLLPGDGLAQAGGPGSLTISQNFYPPSFHPGLEYAVTKTYANAMALRPLTTYDASQNLVCLACEELPTLENGGLKVVERPDGSKGADLTFTLDEGLTWGDGTPVTTKDVLFSWEVGRDVNVGYTPLDLYKRQIVGITAVDDRTFTIHWNQVKCTYEDLNDFHIIPEHVEGPIYRENPIEYRNRSAYITSPTNPGLWFGPYRPSQIVPAANIVMVRNEHWKGPKPAFDRVILRYIENQTALEQNLLSGAVDYVPGESSFTIDQATQIERRHKGRFNIVWKPMLSYGHIDLQLAHPALSNVDVRRSLLHAIDREQIAKSIYLGRATVANHSTAPWDPVYNGDVPTYGYDLEKAAALLDQAGWKRGDDGIRRNADGTPFSLELRTASGSRNGELLLQYMQDQYRKLGIDTRLKLEPARVLFGDVLDKRQFEGGVLFTWTQAPRNIPRSTLHSTMIPRQENGWSGQNYPGYSNPEMDQALDALETTCKAEPRQALFDTVQALYARDLPVLPMVYPHIPYVMPTWLGGVEPTGHQYPTTFWIENWTRQ